MSGATWVTGIITNAVHLDGTANGYVSFPAGLVSTLTDFSICCWVKVGISAMWARAFDFGSGTGTYMFMAPFSGSGTVRYASRPAVMAVNKRSPIRRRFHRRLASSGGDAVWDDRHLYIDGNAVGTNSNMTLNPSSLGSTTQNYLGKSQYSDPNLTGSVDDFRIYARALSGGESRLCPPLFRRCPPGLPQLPAMRKPPWSGALPAGRPATT